MTTLKQQSSGRSDLFKLDPRLIQIESGFNARNFDAADVSEHIDALALSIRENGVRVPLTVRMDAGNVTLVDGECRLRAVRKLISDGVEIATVPVMAATRYESDEERLASSVTLNSGKPFTRLELANVCKRLMAYGWTVKQIAEKLGKTVPGIKSLLELTTLPQKVKSQIEAGKVSATAAQKAVKEHGADAADIIDSAEKQSNGKAKPKSIENKTYKTDAPWNSEDDLNAKIIKMIDKLHDQIDRLNQQPLIEEHKDYFLGVQQGIREMINFYNQENSNV